MDAPDRPAWLTLDWLKTRIESAAPPRFREDRAQLYRILEEHCLGARLPFVLESIATAQMIAATKTPARRPASRAKRADRMCRHGRPVAVCRRLRRLLEAARDLRRL